MTTSDSGPTLVRARPSNRLREALTDWHERLPTDWRKHFEDVSLDFEGFDLASKASEPDRFWPDEGIAPNGEPVNLFKPFQDLSPAEVQVAIFGNDPYPEKGRATGRAFEQGDMTDWRTAFRQSRRVSRSLGAIALAASASQVVPTAPNLVDPASRVRLRKVLRRGGSGLTAPNRCFAHWAGQGVLWVNRALTHSTEADKPAHLRLWKPFTSRLLQVLAEQAGDRPVVVALWGRPASKLIGETILPGGRGLHFVTADHPSAPGGAFFKNGNPLVDVNEALGPSRTIAWTPSAS